MQGTHSFECRVNRAIAGFGRDDVLAIDLHFQRRLSRAAGAADNLQRHDLQPIPVPIRCGRNQSDDIVVIDFLLAVGEFLEPHENILQLVVTDLVSQISQLGAQRGASRVFAQRQRGAGNANIFGPHDFKRLGVFQHTILMDTAFMRKGVFANDGLVKLHRETRHRADPARNMHDLFSIDVGEERHDVSPHTERHNNFFQSGVARALAQTIDRAFDLPCAAFNSRQRVRRRHAQIVMAMGGENHIFCTRHLGNQAADQVSTFDRSRVANGVRNVDR